MTEKKDKKLNRYVLTEELYDILKQQILSHRMAAGDKINIDRLSRELGVSNIPIRESLSRLASEGFVTLIPFKGMYVAEMSLKDIDEIFEIRSQLEDLSIRKSIAHIPPHRLEAVLENLLSHEPGRGEVDRETRIFKMNGDLHGTILHYAKNENLKDMVTSLIQRIHRYLNDTRCNIDVEAEKIEHEFIVSALLKRDTEQAAEAMRNHLRNAHERLRVNFEI